MTARDKITRLIKAVEEDHQAHDPMGLFEQGASMEMIKATRKAFLAGLRIALFYVIMEDKQ